MQYDLKELERRAFRSTFQDGLWDIYLGLVFVAFGIGPILRSTVSEASGIIGHIVLLVIAMMLLIVGKQSITAPRLGHVRFSEARKRKLSKSRIVLALSVIMGLIVFAITLGGDQSLATFSLLFGVNIILVLGALAYFMDYGRLFGYAILWALSMPVGVVLENSGILADAPVIFVATGGLAVVIGFWLLQQFLHDYHLPPPEEGANG